MSDAHTQQASNQHRKEKAHGPEGLPASLVAHPPAHASRQDAVAAHLHTEEGLRAALIATLGLLLTGAVELAIFTVSGSAALLADALHNLGDVSTTVAIWLAFSLSRRAASRRYPYGLYRAEDLAGLFVVVAMATSAALAGWESVQQLVEGERPRHLLPALAAALVGVLGNEAVARYKIHMGRHIGSVALEADGYHSRQDALVSLAAVLGLLGVAAGLDWADGAAGLVITAVIAFMLVSTARQVLGRALDAVEPALLEQIAEIAAAVPGVQGVHDVRARWAGRALWASLTVELPATMPLAEAHGVAERVRHALFHAMPNLVDVDVHMDPGPQRGEHHRETVHHRAGSANV